MGLRHLAAIALASAITLPAQAQEFVSLQPSSDWALTRTDDYCVIARNFGEGAQATHLDLRSYRPEGLFYVLVSGGLAQPVPTAERIRFVMGTGEYHDPTFVSGTIAGRTTTMLKPAFSLGPLAREAEERMAADLPVQSYSEPAAEAGVREFRFLDGMQPQFALETGSLGHVMDALRQCARQLPDDWGVSFEEHMALSRIAKPDGPFRWLGSRSFQRRLAEGSWWSLRLIVDETGRVADCHLTGAASEQDAARACETARDKARFEPALDADGNPARDYWLLTIQP